MATTIEIASKCDIRSVIRFLQAEGHSTVEIHRRLCNVYEENVMSDGSVREWCQKFKEGRIDVPDEGGLGRKSVATDDVVERVDGIDRERRRFTITELSADFSRSALYNILTQKLRYRKLCARWVPKPRQRTTSRSCTHTKPAS